MQPRVEQDTFVGCLGARAVFGADWDICGVTFGQGGVRFAMAIDLCRELGLAGGGRQLAEWTNHIGKSRGEGGEG